MSENADIAHHVSEFRHDPFCRAYGIEMWSHVTECGPCSFIAEIREDERKKITERE